MLLSGLQPTVHKFFPLFSFEVIMATYFFMTYLTDEETQRTKHLVYNKYETTSDCHIWKGPCTPAGSGILGCSFRGKKLRTEHTAPSIIFMLIIIMSSRLHVSHLFPYKLCVNVSHLGFEPQSVNNNRHMCS